MVPNAVENQIITLPAFGEILLGIVNDPIRADGSDHVHILRTAYTDHMCAEPLSYLHSERTHASRCAVNQHLLPGLNLSLIAKPLQCRKCRDTYRSRLLKRHIIWFDCQCRLGSAHIFGKSPTAGAEYLVAQFELRYVSANRFDVAGHINA